MPSGGKAPPGTSLEACPLLAALLPNQLFGWCNINTSGQLLLVKNDTVPLGRAVLNYKIKQWGILLPRLLRASASDWALRSFRV